MYQTGRSVPFLIEDASRSCGECRNGSGQGESPLSGRSDLCCCERGGGVIEASMPAKRPGQLGLAGNMTTLGT
jgi:hypothetical protein